MTWKFWSRDRSTQSKPPLHLKIRHYLTNGSKQKNPMATPTTTSTQPSGTSQPSDLADPTKRAGAKPAGGRPCIIMPLYIYPLPGKDSWKPLYDAVSSNPQTDFIVIVNPNSGPGDQPLPGADYVREVPILNAFPNVRTVGYIAVTWADKDLDKAKAEIRRFAGWHTDHDVEGLHVEGIYLDETPNHGSEHCDRYLGELGKFVKGCEGLMGERLVIHNPGCPPEGPLHTFGSPDIVCVSEEPYTRFVSAEVQSRVATYKTPYDKTFFQISGVPLGEIRSAVEGMIFDLKGKGQQSGRKGRGRYVFVTDLREDFYESFGESWGVFVDAVGQFGREFEE